MIRIVGSFIVLATIAVASGGAGCRTAAGRTYYAPAAAVYAPAYPLVTYYPAVPATYSASYGLSSEGLEILKMVLERDALREAKYEALLQRVIEANPAVLPAKAPAHPGLVALTAKCASCHDSARAKVKGDIGFLRAGQFVDEGDNLPRVLDMIDPWGPKAAGGKAAMPPKGHPPLTETETLQATSFLNRLPPPKEAAKAPDKEPR